MVEKHVIFKTEGSTLPKLNVSNAQELLDQSLQQRKDLVVLLTEGDLDNLPQYLDFVKIQFTVPFIAELKSKGAVIVYGRQGEQYDRVFILYSSKNQCKKTGFTTGKKHLTFLTSNKVTDLTTSLIVSDKIQSSFLNEYLYGFYQQNFSWQYRSLAESKQNEETTHIFKPIKLINLAYNLFNKEESDYFRILSQHDQIARNLINKRPNECNPEYLYREAVKFQQQNANLVELNFIKGKELDNQGLKLMWHVGMGSTNEPYLICLKYNGDPENKDKVFALVGKGVCFDSGGLSLKSSMMDLMHMDKIGACTVFSVLQAAVALKLKVNLVATMGCVENMPDGNAYRVSDIVQSLKGITVEIRNTDAEGRLVLADALTYTQIHHKPHTIFDYATLTGACMVALGQTTGGLFSNDDQVATSLLSCSQSSHEPLWRLPINDEHRDNILIDQADIQNTGKVSYGGSCYAAAFLEKFVEKNVKWAHFDIANAVLQRGVGNQVRTTIEYLKQQYQ